MKIRIFGSTKVAKCDDTHLFAGIFIAEQQSQNGLTDEPQR